MALWRELLFDRWPRRSVEAADSAFWRSLVVQFGFLLVLFALYFVADLDRDWLPYDQREMLWLLAVLMVALMALLVGISWLCGRLARVRVEWGFLWRLELVLTAWFLPLTALEIARGYSHFWFRAGNFLSWVSFAVSSIIFWRALQLRYPMRIRQLLITAGPGTLLVLAVMVWSTSQGPSFARAAWNWRTHDTPRVRLYYPFGVNPQGAAVTAQRSAQSLERVEKLLAVPREERRVNLFLFPGLPSLQSFLSTEDAELMAAVAGSRGVLATWGDWHSIENTIVHEWTHLVLANRVSIHIPAVLNEGTATWAEGELSGKKTKPSAASIIDLARNDDFYHPDWQTRVNNYQRAGSFAAYYIRREGIEKWKRFCDAASAGTLQMLLEDSGAAQNRLKNAFRQVYGREMPS